MLRRHAPCFPPNPPARAMLRHNAVAAHYPRPFCAQMRGAPPRSVPQAHTRGIPLQTAGLANFFLGFGLRFCSWS